MTSSWSMSETMRISHEHFGHRLGSASEVLNHWTGGGNNRKDCRNRRGLSTPRAGLGSPEETC